MKQSPTYLSLTGIVEVIKRDRWITGIYIIVAAIVGIIVAFSIPRIYKTTVVLAPEESSNNLMGNISSIASMVGMDMNLGESGDAIYPEIYPDVLKSTDFVISLFPIQVTNKDKSVTCDYSTHLTKYCTAPWWDKMIVWGKKTFLPKKEMTVRRKGEAIDPFCLTEKEYELYKAVSGNLNCSVDKKTNVISITVTDQDPRVSAIMADSIQTRLQTYITDYRTKKARADVKYLEKICQEAKAQYNSAEAALAGYSNSHLDAVMASVSQNEEKLRSEMQLRQEIYSTVAQQLQIAKAKVQEKTPAFTTIQRASMPVKHSNTPKVVILAFFILLAIFLRSSILAVKYRNILWTTAE